MVQGEQALHATCRCGAVKLALDTAPFLSAVCYCDDCQAAGHRLEALESAPTVLDPDGGSDYVMVRKDRVRIASGQHHLAEFRLKPGSSTRRVVATCCNTPMFLDVTIAHWITLFSDRLPPEARKPVEMRVMTKYRKSSLPYPDAALTYRDHTGRFVLKVLGAWIAMGFRRPRLPDYPQLSV